MYVHGLNANDRIIPRNINSCLATSQVPHLAIDGASNRKFLTLQYSMTSYSCLLYNPAKEGPPIEQFRLSHWDAWMLCAIGCLHVYGVINMTISPEPSTYWYKLRARSAGCLSVVWPTGELAWEPGIRWISPECVYSVLKSKLVDHTNTWLKETGWKTRNQASFSAYHSPNQDRPSQPDLLARP